MYFCAQSCLCIQNTAARINTVSNWPAVIASSALLRASDAISNQRALGVIFWINCTATVLDMIRFSTFAGRSDSLLHLASSFDTSVTTYFRELYDSTPLQRNVTMLMAIVGSAAFPSICTNFTQGRRNAMKVQWKDEIQTYLIEVIDNVRNNYVISGIVQVFCIS